LLVVPSVGHKVDSKGGSGLGGVGDGDGLASSCALFSSVSCCLVHRCLGSFLMVAKATTVVSDAAAGGIEVEWERI
jgi:hypothetical protein